MASDASHMLEAALEQMDDIIAGKKVNRCFFFWFFHHSFTSSSYCIKGLHPCFTDLQLASCYFLAVISGVYEWKYLQGLTLEPPDSAYPLENSQLVWLVNVPPYRSACRGDGIGGIVVVEREKLQLWYWLLKAEIVFAVCCQGLEGFDCNIYTYMLHLFYYRYITDYSSLGS